MSFEMDSMTAVYFPLLIRYLCTSRYICFIHSSDFQQVSKTLYLLNQIKGRERTLFCFKKSRMLVVEMAL